MFDDLFIPVLVILLAIGAVVGGIVLAGNVYSAYQCSNYATITGKETRYAQFDICYIKTAEGWQRWDEYVKRATASEGLKGLK